MEEVEALKLKVFKLEPHESLRHAEVYYINSDWFLCCRFQLIDPSNGGCLGVGRNFVLDYEADGQPHFIELLRGKQRWKPSDSFRIPKAYELGKIKYNIPLEGWYPNLEVISDKEMRNVCLHLTERPVSKNIKIADNVIFSLDKENYLHRIWLFNIEIREK
jgi:hypothetical protein